jgi:hypothetical protein
MKSEVESAAAGVGGSALRTSDFGLRTSPARFTLDGSPALEAHLARVCEQVRDGVRALVPADKLDAVMLGGGYGRGEGGVLRTPAGDQPYNDLESFVLVRGNAVLVERKFRHLLHELGERLSPDAGLEVEFKVITLDKLRRSGPSLFYYDLVMGHRWLVGEESLLSGCEQHRDASRIPLHEATRLLMNRCSGLLFALERLQRRDFSAADADFVGRNLAKAQLAFGDVFLTAHGQYHWSCRERHERLKQLAGAPASGPAARQSEISNLKSQIGGATAGPEVGASVADLFRHHAAGVEFKLHPVRSSEGRESLAKRHAELSALGRQLWLWLESKRLGRAFASPRDYALSALDKCPETSSLRNRLVNGRAFGLAGALGASGARYPRERLFHALSLLLWEPSALTDAALLARLQAQLRTDARDLPGLVAAYQKLWNRFN